MNTEYGTREPSPLTGMEIMYFRCLVLAARGMMRIENRPCTSPLECEECAMPARAHARVCEQCGSGKLKPYDPKTGGYS